MKLVEAILSEKIEVTERWGVSDVWLRDSTYYDHDHFKFTDKFAIIWYYRLNLPILNGSLRIDMIISVQVPYLVQEILGYREYIGSSSWSDSLPVASESLG